MTTPNPWERLREAAHVVMARYDNCERLDKLDGLGVNQFNALRAALAALPATPPEQPVPDVERERAIDEATGCDDGYGALDHAMQILRGCTAPYSGEQAQAVAKGLRQWHDKWATLIDNALGKPPESDAVVARIAEWTHRYGTELIPPGGWADSFGDGMRCAKTQVQHLMKLDDPKPVPAPPASDWRERFAEGFESWPSGALEALHDGLAALEAEVARLRAEVRR